MSIRQFFVLALLIAALALAFMPEIAATITPAQKEAKIIKSRAADVQALMTKAGLHYPPAGVFIRAFKGDDALELWARDASAPEYRLLKIYPICARSGTLGPKRRQGDGQVPEGVYRIIDFNPASTFHLSMHLNYPNASDKILKEADDAGDLIYVHGNCVTIGCIPIQDDPIEEVYVLSQAAFRQKKPINVHIFPCRLDSKECRSQMAGMIKVKPGLRQFWEDLDRIQAAFNQTRKLPKVTIEKTGRYVLSPG